MVLNNAAVNPVDEGLDALVTLDRIHKVAVMGEKNDEYRKAALHDIKALCEQHAGMKRVLNGQPEQERNG